MVPFEVTSTAISQPGEGPSRGLLRDYEPSDGPSFQALLLTEQTDACIDDCTSQ